VLLYLVQQEDMSWAAQRLVVSKENSNNMLLGYRTDKTQLSGIRRFSSQIRLQFLYFFCIKPEIGNEVLVLNTKNSFNDFYINNGFWIKSFLSCVSSARLADTNDYRGKLEESMFCFPV
jgi:hypothetical protein